MLCHLPDAVVLDVSAAFCNVPLQRRAQPCRALVEQICACCPLMLTTLTGYPTLHCDTTYGLSYPSDVMGASMPSQMDGPPQRVEHGDVWWLDAVTRQMVEQRLHLNGMLTFTLRGGRPINLSREQVSRNLHPIPAHFRDCSTQGCKR